MNRTQYWRGLARHTRDRWNDQPRTVTLLRGDIVLRDPERLYTRPQAVNKTYRGKPK